MSFDDKPRIYVTRHHRFWWSVRITHGLIEYRRHEDGGPFAFTQRRAEIKGRRMLMRYLAEREPPDEYEVTP